MMKRLLALMMTAVICTGLVACSSGKSPDKPASTEAAQEADTGDENVGMPNPMKEVTEQELMDQTGIDLPAPDGATDVKYYVIDADEYTISQMDFTLDGKAYTLRACSTGMTELGIDAGIDAKPEELAGFDFDKGNISGLYYEWTSMGTYLVKDRSALFNIADKEGVGYIAWVDPAPGILYNLIMEEDAEGKLLTETAEKVFVPVQGDVGGWYDQVLADPGTKEDYAAYRLIDIDQDGVEELFLSTTEDSFISDIDKACVLAQTGEDITYLLEIGASAGDAFFYSEAEKALTWYYRSSGERHLEVYQLKDGALDKIATADIYDPNHHPEKENKETVYLVNGEEVSEKECTAFWDKYALDEYAVSYEPLPE